MNPEKLGPQRQLEVCLQCHLESTTSPLPAMLHRYDRSAFSFRPGEPLGQYMLHFERSLARSNPSSITPLLRIRQTKRQTRLSPIRCSRNFSNHS